VSRATGEERALPSSTDESERESGAETASADRPMPADPDWQRFDGRPTRVGSALSLLVGTVAVAATLAGGTAAPMGLRPGPSPGNHRFVSPPANGSEKAE